MSSIYHCVWDKGLLGVAEDKYGKQLAYLYDECLVTGNLPRQHKVTICAPLVSFGLAQSAEGKAALDKVGLFIDPQSEEEE
jgi:hypothetical protein